MDIISYNTIVALIKNEITIGDNGWRISERYEAEPRLPIDIFCSKEKGYDKEAKKPEIDYHVFIVASVNNVTEYFQYLLSFCRFFLAFNVTPSPRDLKLTLAVAESAKVENEGFYEKNGFGLWKVIKEKDRGGREELKISKPVNPVPLRDKQKESFREWFQKRDKYLGKEEKRQMDETVSTQIKELACHDLACECITRFFDQYIRDAGEAVISYKPIRFDERLIDKKLMELNIELKHVSYREDLFRHLNEHLSYKQDDYLFCSKKLKELWSDYFKDAGYPNIQEKFEKFLKEFFPWYRDHFLHQYQNFLLGTYMIDGLIENGFLNKGEIDDYCRGWLLASTFHDFAYCIQEYDKFSKPFTSEVLGIQEPTGSLELKTHYIENGFSSSIEHVLTTLNRCFDIKDEEAITTLNNLRYFFYKQMTDRKNHAIVSGLTLYKRLEKSSTREFAQIVLPSVVSIILHDDEIWQPLSGFKGKKTESEETWIINIREAKPLKNLSFAQFPIAFLLLLCDNVQDWGRPFKDDELNKLSEEAEIHLKDIIIKPEGVKIQIYLRVTGKTKQLLDHKRDVFNQLKILLKSPVPFIVSYWDSETDQETDYIFRIGGNDSDIR